MSRNQEWSRPRLATQLLAHAADLSVVADGVEALTRVELDPEAPIDLHDAELAAAEAVVSLARDLGTYAEQIRDRLKEAERS